MIIIDWLSCLCAVYLGNAYTCYIFFLDPFSENKTTRKFISVKKTGLHQKSNIIIEQIIIIIRAKIITTEITEPINAKNWNEVGIRVNLVQTVHNTKIEKDKSEQLTTSHNIEGE